MGNKCACDLAVLEAVVICGEHRTDAISDVSGYCLSLATSSLRYLATIGLIIHSRTNYWSATERGRIAVALYKGRQHRRNHLTM
jgi:hypothetical protein